MTLTGLDDANDSEEKEVVNNTRPSTNSKPCKNAIQINCENASDQLIFKLKVVANAQTQSIIQPKNTRLSHTYKRPTKRP